MFRFCPIASGSKGNCTYLNTPQAHLLIDVGISARAIEKHLEALEVTPNAIDAILLTHEHTDHIRAAKIFSEKWQTPLICNRETAKAVCAAFETHTDFRFKLFTTEEPFTFADLTITPFGVQHDAIEPVGFRLDSAGWSAGICTDLGMWTQNIADHLRGCDVLLIEANHEPEYVFASPRSRVYKERVTGRFGHLSNQACAELIEAMQTKRLTHVYLGHLSSECNSPEKALAVISKHLQCIPELIVAGQNERSPTYVFACAHLHT